MEVDISIIGKIIGKAVIPPMAITKQNALGAVANRYTVGFCKSPI